MSRVLLLVCAFGASVAVQADEGIRIDIAADVGLLFDDNVGQAADGASKPLDDQAFVLSASAGYRDVLSFSSRVNYRLGIEHQAFQTYTGLDQSRGLIEINYQYKPSAAFTATNYSAFVIASIIDSASSIRDGYQYDAGAMVLRRVTDRIALVGQYGLRERFAEGVTHDTSTQSLLVNVDYLLAQHSTFYTTFNYVMGDLVSSGNPSFPVTQILDEVEADDAFGGGSANQFAYRFAGTSQVQTFGYNYSIDKAQSLDLSYRVISSESDEGKVSYSRNQWLISYLRRF